MKRIIFDTSVYGKLSEDPEMTDAILKRLSKEFVVYGTDVIKNELRETPKHVFHSGKNLRNILLSLYRSFVRKSRHYLRFNKLIETLAKDYMTEYRKKGGNLSDKKMKNDLTIIATATIYSSDSCLQSRKQIVWNTRPGFQALQNFQGRTSRKSGATAMITNKFLDTLPKLRIFHSLCYLFRNSVLVLRFHKGYYAATIFKINPFGGHVLE